MRAQPAIPADAATYRQDRADVARENQLPWLLDLSGDAAEWQSVGPGQAHSHPNPALVLRALEHGTISEACSYRRSLFARSSPCLIVTSFVPHAALSVEPTVRPFATAQLLLPGPTIVSCQCI